MSINDYVTVSSTSPTYTPHSAQSGTSSADGFFGTGADGDVTIAVGTTTLTRDMQYNNLVVNGTLETAGYVVKIKGTLTGAGAIRVTALDNPQTGGGVPFNAISGKYISLANSGQGGAGGAAAGTAAAGAGFATSLGGQGGAGGAGSGGAGGAGGALSGITAATAGVALADVTKIDPLMLWLAHGLNATGLTAQFNGGSAGGGGGGDGTSGAGGGQAGGVCVVFAYNASAFTGTIAANGGAGGSAAAGNRGGGGGGGGGLAALFARTLPTGAYTMTATGALGGAKTGTGVAGSPGLDGTTIARVI